MDHEEIRERLFELYDGELRPEERALLEAHLKACPDCCRAHESWGRIAGALFAAPEPPISEAFVGKVMARLDAGAASAGLAAGPGLGRGPLAWLGSYRPWSAPAYGLGLAAALLAISLARRAEPVLPEDLLLAGAREDAAVEWLLRAAGPGPEEWLGSVLEEP